MLTPRRTRHGTGAINCDRFSERRAHSTALTSSGTYYLLRRQTADRYAAYTPLGQASFCLVLGFLLGELWAYSLSTLASEADQPLRAQGG